MMSSYKFKHLQKMKKILILCLLCLIFSIAQHKACADNNAFYIYGTKCPDVYISDEMEKKKSTVKTPYLNNNKQFRSTFCFFNKGLDFSVMPDTIPNKSDLIDKFEVCTTAGEYEPVIFCIRSEMEINDFYVQVTDLHKNKTAKINKINISINYVKLFPQLIGNNKYRLKPLILEKMESISVPEQYTKQIWLNVFVPPDTPPGVYKGYVYLRSKNLSLNKISLEVTVLPFKLKETKRNYGMYYYIDSRWQGFYPENMLRHFLDMKYHGLNTAAVYVVPFLNSDNDKIIIDFDKPGTHRTTSLDQLMEIYLQSGFDRPIVFMGLDSILKHQIGEDLGLRKYSKGFDNAFVDIIRNIESQIVRNGWPEFIYSPTDEPASSQDRMKMCKYYLKLFKTHFSENKTYLTLNGSKKGIDDGAYFDPWLDIRCYAFLNQELIEKTNSSGDELWIYNGGSFGFEPRYDRLFFGFYAEKINADGVMQWAYQWPATLEASPYDEISNNQQGWYYAYPSEEGPLPTVGWEAVREGIDDAKYIDKLKELIDMATISQDTKLIEKGKKSKKILHSILNNINVKFHSNSSITYEDLSSWRKLIIAEIMKFPEANISYESNE